MTIAFESTTDGTTAEIRLNGTKRVDIGPTGIPIGSLNGVAALAGSASQVFSVAAATAAGHAVRLDQISAASWPMFSAYAGTATSLVSATPTKVRFFTEEYDTTSAYDNATNFRFTPQVAGYYRVTAAVQLAATTASIVLYLYKNGSNFKHLTYSASTSAESEAGSVDLYLNGTTDYIEIFCLQGAATQNCTTGAASTYFQAALIVRA